jgi:hypothetical protein
MKTINLTMDDLCVDWKDLFLYFQMEEVTHPLLPSNGIRMHYKQLGEQGTQPCQLISSFANVL